MGLTGGPKTVQTQNQNTNTSNSGSQTQDGTSLGYTGTQSTGSQQGANRQAGATQGQFAQTTTPNLPAWYSSFLQSIPGQYQSLSGVLNQQMGKQLYGPQQEADFRGALGANQGQQQQQLQSQLASQGALNSGRASQQGTQLALGGQQQLADYLSGVPAKNAAYQQQTQGQLGQLLGQQQGFTAPVGAFGSTTSGNQSQQSIQDFISSLLTNNQSATGYGGATSQNGTSNSTGSSTSNTTDTKQTFQNPASMSLNAGLGILGALAK